MKDKRFAHNVRHDYLSRGAKALGLNLNIENVAGSFKLLAAEPGLQA